MSIPSHQRIATIRRRIASLDYVCSGNLRRRTAVCGTRNCRCKTSSPEPHGPYYYWSRLLAGKVVQRVLSQKQAKFVARAIRNYREAKMLLRRWEKETAQRIESRNHTKP